MFKNIYNDILMRRFHKSTYQSYIAFANQIFATVYDTDKSMNEILILNAINKIIRVLSLDTQKNIIDRTLKQKQHCPDDDIFLILTPDHCSHCGSHIPVISPHEVPAPIMLDISANPAISFPWHHLRLLSSLGKIGQNIDNPFTFDKINHFGNLLISPINLFITGNGYHSTTAGIYDSKAISYAQNILDISPLYDAIYFDGVVFRHNSCNYILDSPLDKSIGIIYEIGRLLTQNHLNLLSLHTK